MILVRQTDFAVPLEMENLFLLPIMAASWSAFEVDAMVPQ